MGNYLKSKRETRCELIDFVCSNANVTNVCFLWLARLSHMFGLHRGLVSTVSASVSRQMNDGVMQHHD